jgi:molecular chaperone DnaK (HSP70)
MLKDAKEGNSGGISLIDVTPLSLGTDVIGGFMSTIIPKGTIIPAKITKGYETAHDY